MLKRIHREPTGPPGPKMAKTSMSLPAELWTRTRIRAIEEGRNAQDLVADALGAYLKKGGSQ